MANTVFIIGGTGLIGKSIHNMLIDRNPDMKILIGTRKKSSYPNHILFDVNDPEGFDKLKDFGVEIIVLCTKDTNNNVLNFSIRHKIDYIDITKPSGELLKAKYSIRDTIIESKIVFSSGWMGGIAPSILYSTGISANDVKGIAIIVYYSAKDKAGKSSADFMAENVSKPFIYYENNIAIQTKHFLHAYYFTFAFDNQRRKVFDFDIPDLYIFNQVENIPSVRAKLTLDSKFVTALLAAMQKVGFFKILNFKKRKLIFGGSGNGDVSAFEIVYSDGLNERKIALKSENGQSELTAFSTALHVEEMLKNNKPAGIYFSHQLHDSNKFIDLLTSNRSISIQ